jgi:hypothetical protein
VKLLSVAADIGAGIVVFLFLLVHSILIRLTTSIRTIISLILVGYLVILFILLLFFYIHLLFLLKQLLLLSIWLLFLSMRLLFSIMELLFLSKQLLLFVVDGVFARNWSLLASLARETRSAIAEIVLV